MFFGGKRTVYLSRYYNGQKVKSAGFLQITGIQGKLKFTIQIKNCEEIPDAEYAVFLYYGEKSVQIGNVFLRDGAGCFEKNFCTSNYHVRIKEVTVPIQEITAVIVELTEKETVSGYLTAIKQREREPVAEIQAEEKQAAFQEAEWEPLCTDKWEQILKKYSNIHPFNDDRIFVRLNLQELVVLPEKYQKLIHNSFLLHGFYNYRHLILGKDFRLGSSVEKCFYLGVPGVFFEREKQVAVMFGFEGFECAGAVEIGKFGYYVKEVSI